MIFKKIFLGILIATLFGCVASHRQVYNSNYQLPPQYSKNHDWVGKRIIFLKTNEELQKYGYQGFSYNDKSIAGSIPYNALAGKTAEVIGYKARRYPKVVFKLDDSNFIVCTNAYGNNINDIGFVSEIDNSRKYIGKTVWNKGHPS